MLRCKVCGLTCAEDVAQALREGADFLGFVSHPPSPRNCPDLDLARGAGERAVLVIVAPDAAPVLEGARAHGFRWVQPYLPAEARAEGVRRLREAGLRVLLPWPDEPGLEPVPADAYVWETSRAQTGLHGGSGQGHAMGFPPPGPFLLAGGLGADNVAERYRELPESLKGRCLGVDAASRLEASPGRKDPALVTRYIQQAHSLELS